MHGERRKKIRKEAKVFPLVVFFNLRNFSFNFLIWWVFFLFRCSRAAYAEERVTGHNWGFHTKNCTLLEWKKGDLRPSAYLSKHLSASQVFSRISRSPLTAHEAHPPPPLRFLPRHETVVSFMQYSTAGKQAFLRERGSSMPHQVLNTWSLITAWNVVIPLSFSRLRENWFVWISRCTKLWKKVFLWGRGWILHQVFCDVVRF